MGLNLNSLMALMMLAKAANRQKTMAETLLAAVAGLQAGADPKPPASKEAAPEDSCPCPDCVARRNAGIPLHSQQDMIQVYNDELEKQKKRNGVPHPDDDFVKAMEFFAQGYDLVAKQLSARSLSRLGFDLEPTSPVLDKIKQAFVDKVNAVGNESLYALRYLAAFKLEQNKLKSQRAESPAS